VAAAKERSSPRPEVSLRPQLESLQRQLEKERAEHRRRQELVETQLENSSLDNQVFGQTMSLVGCVPLLVLPPDSCIGIFPDSFLRFECVFLSWLCFLVPSLGLLCGQLPSSQFWLYIFVFHSLVRLNFIAFSLGQLLLFLRRDYFTVTLSYRFWFLY
jgi:hypothetical protein